MPDKNIDSFPPTNATVPVAHVVDRIVKETLDSIATSQTGETQDLQAWIDAAAVRINQHPAKLNLISWLALEGIGDKLCCAAGEYDLDNAYTISGGSPRIEATEADVKHSQAMLEAQKEWMRKSRAS